MLENAETSFPLLKVARSTKFLKRRELEEQNTDQSTYRAYPKH